MMRSSNGNSFRVTGHLCGEFTGHRWIPCTKASDTELWWVFYLHLNKRLSKRWWGLWFETPWRSLCRHCNDKRRTLSGVLLIITTGADNFKIVIATFLFKSANGETRRSVMLAMVKSPRVLYAYILIVLAEVLLVAILPVLELHLVKLVSQNGAMTWS